MSVVWGMTFFTIVCVVIIFVYVLMSVKFIDKNQCGVVDKLGKYQRTLQPGLNRVNPFTEKVRTVLMNDLNKNIKSIRICTADNKFIEVDAKISHKIIDPVKAVYGTNDFSKAVSDCLTIALKSLLSKMNLEEINNSKSAIEHQLCDDLRIDLEKIGAIINEIAIDISSDNENVEQINMQESKEYAVMDGLFEKYNINDKK